MTAPNTSPKDFDEPHGNRSGTSARKTHWVWLSVIAAVLAVGIAAWIAIPAIGHAQAVARFTEIVRQDSSMQVHPDADLSSSYDVNCKLVAEGWDEADVILAATRSWPAVEATSKVSMEQFVDNKLGFFKAAQATC
ncbi:hypothetical protein ACTJJ4_07870 [Microbacterium sp. 22195]|uniref:hypothetical protein n=1 Tax=Microbacterium sp. 22195 TaxID=3453891 RepID=UPI003F8289E4